MRFRSATLAVFALSLTLPAVATGATAAQAQAIPTRSVAAASAPAAIAKAARSIARAPGKKVQPAATVATNPKIPETCGLDVTLTLDSSGSIGGNAQNVRNAATDFAAALKNTNSTMRITRFSKTSSQLAARVPVNDTTTGPGGSLANGIANYPTPTGGTNWQEGFNYTKTGDSLIPELLIFVTDGNPTLWGSTGSGGTGSETSSNIANSLAQAIPAANSVKTQAANRTRVLMVGVGNGVTDADSRQRMTQVSGPQVITSATGLVGKSINDVDVAAFKEFTALGTFLRSVVTSLCGNGVTVQKLAQTADGAEYVPAQGWDMTVKPTVSGGYTWVDPAGTPANTPATRATSGDQATAAFQWKPITGSQSADVQITEQVKNGFTADTWECEIRSADGTTVKKNGGLQGGSFTIAMKPSDVGSCVLKNNFNYDPGISITKTAADNPVRGNADGWNEQYTFKVTNTGNAALTVAKPVDTKCEDITGPTGPGSGTGKLQPGVEWTYQCTRLIKHPTVTGEILAPNTVSVAGVPPKGAAVTAQATATVNVKTPDIEVIKTAKKTQSQDPIVNGGSVPAGTGVTYIYTVNNVGNDVLKDVVVSDNKCSPVNRTVGTGNTLAVGGTWVYECTTVINPPSSQATVDNTVTVTSNWSGYTPSGQNNGAVTDTDDFEIKVDRSASLTIIKSTNPAAVDRDFEFTMSGQGVPSGDESFTLNASAEPDTPPSSRTVELDGPSGGGSPYTVTEAEVTGWDFTGAVCVDQDGNDVEPNFDMDAHTITPTVQPQQDVTCTILNERLPRLQITKQTSPTGASQTFDFDVTDPDPVSSFTLGDGETEELDNLPPSDYSITETVPAGWELDDVDCGTKSFSRIPAPNGPEVSLELDYGDDVECVFSNGKIPPATLTIVKQGNPPSSPAFDFNASGTGLFNPGQPASEDFTLAAGESKTYEVWPAAAPPNTNYTVTEDPPSGEDEWRLTGVECVVNGDSDNPILGDTGTGEVEVPLAPTDTAVCTYTNQRLPQLHIVKNAFDPEEPEDNTPFEFNPTGLSPSGAFNLSNNNNTKTFTNLTVDATFTVTETGESGWTLTSLQCSGEGSGAVDVTIDEGKIEAPNGLGYGDDVTCTFVNTKDPSPAHLYVMKETDPVGSSQSFQFTVEGGELSDSFELMDQGSIGFEVNPNPDTGTEYTVTEVPGLIPQGWSIKDITCQKSTGEEETFPPGAGVATVTLLPDEVAVCAYENQEDSKLTVTKVTDVEPSPAFDFTALFNSVDLNEFSLTGGDSELFAGLQGTTLVSLQELPPPSDAPDRWEFMSLTCMGVDNAQEDLADRWIQFDLLPGSDAECIYANSKVPSASVQIVKSADPADGTTFDFTATGDDGGVVPDPADECVPEVDGQACFSLAPDGGPAVKDLTVYPAAGGETFTFTEEALPDDWNLDSITCVDNGSEVGTPDLDAQKIDVPIDPGDTVVCTFTNRADATLTVIKSASDDPALEFDFDWTPLTPNTFSLTDGQSQTETGLEPDAVTVSEVDLPADWYLAGVNGEHPDCTGAAAPVDYSPTNGATIDIAAGEDVVCMFTNVFDYRPAIQLDKEVNRSVVVAGETVDYTYTVTNTGNTPLTPVGGVDDVISDDKCQGATRISGSGDTLLTADDPDYEPWVYECTGYQVDEDTLNTATATMTGGGTEVTSTDTEFVEVLTPAMRLTKLVDKPIVYPGTAVTYTYELMNTGDTDLQNQISPTDRSAWVTDDKCSSVTYVSGDSGVTNVLEVGEVWLYECTTTIDVTTTNVATATATPLDPDGDVPVGEPLVVTAEQNVEVIKGGITVTKTASAPGGVKVGDSLLVPVGTTVAFTYDVTSGAATVGMKVLSVADDKCSPVTYTSGDTNGNGLVDPGETWRYECTKAFQGSTEVTNTVVATAVEPTLGGVSVATAQATVESFLGSIALTKAPDRDLVPTGSSVTYSYRATNDGTTDLSDIALSDDKCSPLVYVSGDDGDGIMKPGETWTYTCSTSLSVTTTNIAVVTGKTPIGGVVTATTSAQVVVFNPANLDAKIKVKKSASKTKVSKGTKVKYAYKVSNPGKVALAKVKQNMSDNKCRPVRYVRGDKDKNGLLTSGRESGGEFPREVWTFTCKSKIKKTTVNTITAKGKGWLNGEIVGPTVQDKAKAKVRVIGSSGGSNSGGKCKHHGLGWATAAQLEPWAAPTQLSIKCKKGKG